MGNNCETIQNTNNDSECGRNKYEVVIINNVQNINNDFLITIATKGKQNNTIYCLMLSKKWGLVNPVHESLNSHCHSRHEPKQAYKSVMCLAINNVSYFAVAKD